MVGSINAPASGSNTFDAFQAAAIAIGTNEATVSRDHIGGKSTILKFCKMIGN